MAVLVVFSISSISIVVPNFFIIFSFSVCKCPLAFNGSFDKFYPCILSGKVSACAYSGRFFVILNCNYKFLYVLYFA